MYTNYEFDRINSEYKKLITERQIKALKIWGPLMMLSVLLVLGAVFLTEWLESEPGSILIPVYGGIIVVGSIVAVIISKYGISNKPAFNFLYRDIYERINTNESKHIKYYPLEKSNNDFVGRGGIFTRYSRVHCYRHVVNHVEDKEFHIYDCMLITGSGKNQQVHFNGIYYHFKNKANSLLQVRSNGRPHFKGQKYDKIDSSDIFKVFVEEGKSLAGTDQQYIHNMAELKQRLNAKKVYLSITNDEIHFAYVPMKHVRKQRDLTLAKLNELYTFFLNEDKVVKEILAISDVFNY